jgi:sugar phosphate isomerase/epimerase
LFETGQETPTTLLRVIEDIGLDNLGINMDTANLILYGKANSADAITIFGKYVMDTHIKDGLYPTNGKHLGREVKVGEGFANIPEVVKRLREVGYTGNYVIEREIKGDQQIKDIVDTVAYLKNILN